MFLTNQIALPLMLVMDKDMDSMHGIPPYRQTHDATPIDIYITTPTRTHIDYVGIFVYFKEPFLDRFYFYAGTFYPIVVSFIIFLL